MLELVRSLVEASGTFMQHQTSVGHFEFLGLDIIADDAGGVWLMEGEMCWCTSSYLVDPFAAREAC